MKNIIIPSLLLIFTTNLLIAQEESRNDTLSLVEKKYSQLLQIGNSHGLGLEGNFKLYNDFYLNSTLGIKPPIPILLGPPFNSNRFNFTFGIKYKPIYWLYLNGGVYFGLQKLTEYIWINTPKVGLGIEIDDFTFELGALLNTPTKIYTKTKVNENWIVGRGQERLEPSGPTFPFFKIGYYVIK